MSHVSEPDAPGPRPSPSLAGHGPAPGLPPQRRLRLLYLGFALPPGVSNRFPHINPAGHVFELRLLQALAQHLEVHSVGMLPAELDGHLIPPDASPGIDHRLILWDRRPELLHRWLAARQLQRFYLASSVPAPPDVVLTYNLSPVYTHFIRWLRARRPDTAPSTSPPVRPRLALLLADSATLGRSLSWHRRLRYQLKPMLIPDDQALRLFDATLSLSRATRPHSDHIQQPWLWMPGACHPDDTPPAAPWPTGPIRFGYFGALAEHAGIRPFTEAFLRLNPPAQLSICGYGRLTPYFAQLAAQNPRVRFDGLLPRPTDCLTWAQKQDILVNPRPPDWGNENNFPSKIFQYALTRRSILTTRMAGVDEVLGDAAFYFDPAAFDANLATLLPTLAALPRKELEPRGLALHQRVLAHFTWTTQAARIADFLQRLVRPS